jgi:hypothetical protein
VFDDRFSQSQEMPLFFVVKKATQRFKQCQTSDVATKSAHPFEVWVHECRNVL